MEIKLVEQTQQLCLISDIANKHAERVVAGIYLLDLPVSAQIGQAGWMNGAIDTDTIVRRFCKAGRAMG